MCHQKTPSLVQTLATNPPLFPSDTPYERLCGISLQLADESLAARSRAMAEELALQTQDVEARNRDLQARQDAFRVEAASHATKAKELKCHGKELQDRQLALDQEVSRRVALAHKAHFSSTVASSPIVHDPNADAFGANAAFLYDEEDLALPRHRVLDAAVLAESLTSALTGVLQNQNASNIQIASLITENMGSKRKANEELPTPAKRILLEAGPDDAENIWHHQTRNLRPFRGPEWQDRFTHLGRYATPIRKNLAWEPMGVIKVAPVIIKKLHDRGLKIQIRMFSPINVDVACRSGRFHMSEDGESVSIKSHDFKPVLQAWQLVDALTTYTLCLHQVWPEDWTGLALTKILNHYRWLATSGRTKAEQVKLITNFIDTVFTKNAARGRENKIPYSLKEIEQVMETVVWGHSVDKAACIGTTDPFASSGHRPPGTGHAALHHYVPTPYSARGAGRTSGNSPTPATTTPATATIEATATTGATTTPPGIRNGGSGHSTNIFWMSMAQKFAATCVAFNSPSGC